VGTINYTNLICFSGRDGMVFRLVLICHFSMIYGIKNLHQILVFINDEKVCVPLFGHD